jgi:delta24(24(1))-sterol reductase
MIAHRAARDIYRCRNKYGEHWLEYERQVPYLFIPVSFLSLVIFASPVIAHTACSTLSRRVCFGILGVVSYIYNA